LKNEEVTKEEPEVRGEFPNEFLLQATTIPWFANVANYKATRIIPKELNWSQRKKFLHDARFYVWDDPHLFKLEAYNLLRRYVMMEEAHSILWNCHNSPYGGPHNEDRTTTKMLQVGFFWPLIFKDAHEYVCRCDKCQRTGGISKRNEMPLQNIMEVEIFDYWGIDFVGPLPSLYGNIYILVVVDFVSKWVEAIATPKNDVRAVIKFLKKNIFSRFGVPRVLISDGGTHFAMHN